MVSSILGGAFIQTAGSLMALNVQVIKKVLSLAQNYLAFNEKYSFTSPDDDWKLTFETFVMKFIGSWRFGL